MAAVSDYGLMVWDAQSTGTLSNVLELLARGKKSVAFLTADWEFAVVGNVQTLNTLIQRMPEEARSKANRKIKLSERISELK